MTIRHATPDDLQQIMHLLDCGRHTMRQNGDTFQWNGYPTEEQILSDIANGNSYLICDVDKPVATFAMIIGEEPTYRQIFNGQWINDTLPYATVHRLAGLPHYHGLGKICLDFVWSKIHNIRFDTHSSNAILRHLAETNGFHYCGIIYLANGDERMAFQRIDNVQCTMYN